MEIIYDYIDGLSMLDFEGHQGVKYLADYYYKKCSHCEAEEKKTTRIGWKKLKKTSIRVMNVLLDRNFKNEEIGPFIKKWGSKVPNLREGTLFITIRRETYRDELFRIGMSHIKIHSTNDEDKCMDMCGETSQFQDLPRSYAEIES